MITNLKPWLKPLNRHPNLFLLFKVKLQLTIHKKAYIALVKNYLKPAGFMSSGLYQFTKMTENMQSSFVCLRGFT